MSINHTQTVLSALGLPVFVSRRADGQILFVNEQLARLVGSNKDKIVGQYTLDYYANSADRQRILQLIEKDGAIAEKEVQIKHLNGQRIWVLVSSQPITYEGEAAMLTSMVDIDSRKQAETLLKRRAREMETVSQVSAFATTILEMDKLLQSMVDLTKDRFDLYHTHIYLLNKQEDQLNLVAGAGMVGRQMVAENRSIPLAQVQSLVAQAARTRQGVIENDVQKNPAFLPHSLLPETRSEMAVPMLVGNKLVGVLDVQADKVNYFTQESIYIQTTLAAQIAVALQNARSFEQAQKSLLETKVLLDITRETNRFLEMDDMLAAILNKVLSTTKFEAGLVSLYNVQTDSLELLVHKLPEVLYQGIQQGGLSGSLCDLVYRRQEEVMVTDLTKEAPVNVSGLVDLGYHSYQGVPLRSANDVLGTLCIFCSEPLTLEEANTNFLLAVGVQIGMAIQNAKAFERAQQSLHEAQRSEELLALRTRELNELTQRLTREGWNEYLTNAAEKDVRYLFDGDTISETEDRSELAALQTAVDHQSIVQSIEVRGVAIGKMTVVPEDENEDADIEEVISSVMQQLGAHIENLRLTERMQTALAQTEALYTGSERIVLSSTEADVLESLVYSTELRRLDRANIFLFDQPVEDGIPRDVTAVAIWENEGVPRTVEVGTHFTVDQVPFITKITPEKSMIVTDIRQDSRIDETTRQVLESFSMISFVLFPMVVGSQWLGLVSGQSASPLQLNDVQRRQAGSLVSQASVVLQTTILFRQEQARARREQLLREIATKMRSSVDVDTVMRTAVTEIGRTLGRRAFIKLDNGQPDSSQEVN